MPPSFPEARLISVIDLPAIVFRGQLPPELGRVMIERLRLPLQRYHRYGVDPEETELC